MSAPGKNDFVSPRTEKDLAKILSGVFEGKTTGTPIAIIVENKEANSEHYHPIKNLLRPGHANFTYLKKYGVFDYAGGGRASARETIGRVATSVLANKILKHYGIQIATYIKSIGDIEANTQDMSLELIRENTYASPIFCPDESASKRIQALILKLKEEGDSIGGVVEFLIEKAPAGLGEPIYNKLEAMLANAMMSLPATKGFEIGEGFHASQLSGSQHNDLFINQEGIKTATNHAGGILAGISTGMPIIGRVAFKAPSSIKKPQETVDLQGNQATFKLPEGSRHDPCVAIRAVPIVEAMCAIVIADALLLNRSARLEDKK